MKHQISNVRKDNGNKCIISKINPQHKAFEVLPVLKYLRGCISQIYFHNPYLLQKWNILIKKQQDKSNWIRFIFSKVTQNCKYFRIIQ